MCALLQSVHVWGDVLVCANCANNDKTQHTYTKEQDGLTDTVMNFMKMSYELNLSFIIQPFGFFKVFDYDGVCVLDKVVCNSLGLTPI